ncbi:MAG: DUF4143 domain-containing protein [Bacilli bacterium]|nr:DUF4143 domain-containing protein [Bacilli bacterium]MDD4795985.1 DUF4143 domain-containing protein [Bacilli bacterium]
MEYKTRIIEDEIKEKLQYMGGVAIRGPKWCGKTETAKVFSKDIIDLSNEEIQDNIYFQEKKYVKLFDTEKPLLIDEWQLYPSIWNSAKTYIDNAKVPGQFILTGSSTPIEDEKLHPGTGRISLTNMKTMTLFESGESNGSVSIKEILEGTANLDKIKSTITYEQIAYLVCRGGWPNIFNINEEYALKIAKEYIKNLCETDISKYDGEKRNPILASAILKAYARNIHTVNANTTIFEDIKQIFGDVSNTTIYNYVNAFKRLFILEDIPAWNPNIRSKTVIMESPKKSFIDPSIAAAALDTSPEELINDTRTLGLLFENLVYRDLSVYVASLGGYIRHYRDRLGLECDFVAHFENGKYGLIEVKLGASKIKEARDHLIQLKNKIIEANNPNLKEPDFLMIITGANTCMKTDDGIYIIPIDCLKN